MSQPTFIFGGMTTTLKGPQYILGAGLSISAAACGGFFNVLSSKCKDVPATVFMVIGGLMSIVVGFAYCWIFPNENFKPEVGYIAMLGLMGLLTMAGVLFIRLASLFISPVFVSMLRTFEIVMSLALEIIVARHVFDFGQVSFWYKISGCILVTLSVIAMSVSDKINSASCCTSHKKQATNQDPE